MGNFAPKGHARVNPQSPSAFANCDQCGFLYCHADLRWEVQYRGNQIMKTGFLVCPTCWDIPNEQLRPKVLPADPVPILNPRKEAADTLVDQTVLTVATLPSAVTAGDGAYRFVSDSVAPYEVTNLGDVVVGGGTNTVAVESDGTDWRLA